MKFLLTLSVLFSFLITAITNTHTVTNKADSGAFTLRQLIDSADAGDTITFDNSIDTIFLESEIKITDKDLTINGANTNGKVVLDGQGACRVLNILTTDSASISIKNLVLQQGYATKTGGAGIKAMVKKGLLKIENCTITKNIIVYDLHGSSIDYHGAGAILKAVKDSGRVILTNTLFFDNKNNVGDNTVSLEYADLYNCIISNNISLSSISGVNAIYSRLFNCVIAYNKSNGDAGAIYAFNGHFYNCIVFGNTNKDGYYQASRDPYYYNCATQHTYYFTHDRGNNITLKESPFRNPEAYDYRLNNSLAGLKCINTGGPSYNNTLTDFFGNDRVNYNRIDIGAIEYQYTPIKSGYLMVKNDSTNASTVLSLPWTLENCFDGDTILFDRSLVSTIPVTSPLSIGDSNIFIKGEGIVLDGKNESQIMSLNIPSGKTTTINQVIFKNGYAERNGGAIEVISNEGSFVIGNSAFQNNVSLNYGGAIYATKGEIINCTFAKNQADSGGGVFTTAGGQVSNSLFWDNNSNELIADNDVAVNSNALKDTANGYNGSNNIIIDENPFADTVNNKFLLRHHSICVEKGENSLPPPYFQYDLYGKTRILNNFIDIGACEYDYTATKPGSRIVLNDSPDKEVWYSLPWWIDHVIDGDTIKFSDDIDTIKLEKELLVDKYIINIDGRVRDTSRVVLDGQASCRILNVYREHSTTTRISNLIITNGYSENYGGCVYVKNIWSRSIIHIKNCDISNGFSGGGGGGIYMSGAHYPSGRTDIRLIDCKIHDNKSNDRGGGIYMEDANVDYCRVYNNEVTKLKNEWEYIAGGGGIYSYAYSGINNSIIYNNSVIGEYRHGGGIYSGRSDYVYNCIIANNTVENGLGGGVFLLRFNRYANNIIWGNTKLGNSNQAYMYDPDPVICESAIQDGYSGNGNSYGIVTLGATSPFVDHSANNFYPNNLPNGGALCIDKGLNSNASGTYDILGMPRISGDSVDFGPYEIHTTPCELIVKNTSNSPDVVSSLPWILNRVVHGDTILFADNVDTIKLDNELVLGDKSLTFKGKTSDGKNIVLSGKNSNRIFNINLSDSASILFNDLVFMDGKSASNGGALHVTGSNGALNFNNCDFYSNEALAGGAVYTECSALFNSCIFNSNKATGTEGGGINSKALSTIAGCDFDNNTATDIGGAIYMSSPSGTANISRSNFIKNEAESGGAIALECKSLIDSCVFDSNMATGSYAEGGAVWIQDSSLISNCQFTNNTAKSGGAAYIVDGAELANCNINSNEAITGGGIYTYQGGELFKCHIEGNTATDKGGGVYFNSDGKVVNSIIRYNNALNGGGLYHQFGGKVISSNIDYNNATQNGGGSYFFNNGEAVNTIFWNNNASNSSQIYATGYGMDILKCAVQDGYSGNGAGTGTDAPTTLTAIPYMVDSASDFRLNTLQHGGAKCINMGITDSIPSYLTTDIAGNQRIDSIVDIGAYEGAYSWVRFGHTAGGTVTGDTLQLMAYNDTCDTVKASVGEGYHFIGWVADSTVISMDTILVLQNVRTDSVILANFGIDTFSVSYTSCAGGQILGDTLQVINYGSGTSPVGVLPDTGYSFTGWFSNDMLISEDSALTIDNIKKDTNIYACFVIDTFTVVFSSGNGGTIIGDSIQSITFGSTSETVVANADEGFEFIGWMQGDSIVSTDSAYTAHNVIDHIEIEAVFQKLTSAFAFEAGKNIVYPTVAANKLYIVTENDVEVAILNMSGNCLIKALHPIGEKEYHIGMLPKGIYLVQILNKNGGRETFKIVKK